MIIDSHTHLGEYNKKYTVEDLVQSMNLAGIDYSIVLANDHSDRQKPGVSTAQLLELIREYPQLIPVGLVDVKRISTEDQKFIIDGLRSNKLAGLKLFPGYQNFSPDDSRLYELYKTCQELGKPVLFHMGILWKGSKGTLKQAHPLLIDDLASKFPDLNIIIAHMGNPWIIDTGAVMLKNPNVYTDISGFFEEYTPIPTEDIEAFHRQLTTLRSFLGTLDKALFGTDWPLYNQKEYLDAFLSFNLPEEEKERVLWKNAAELYKIPTT